MTKIIYSRYGIFKYVTRRKGRVFSIHVPAVYSQVNEVPVRSITSRQARYIHGVSSRAKRCITCFAKVLWWIIIMILYIENKVSAIPSPN